MSRIRSVESIGSVSGSVCEPDPWLHQQLSATGKFFNEVGSARFFFCRTGLKGAATMKLLRVARAFLQMYGCRICVHKQFEEEEDL